MIIIRKKKVNNQGWYIIPVFEFALQPPLARVFLRFVWLWVLVALEGLTLVVTKDKNIGFY